MRPQSDFDLVRQLAAAGNNDSEIARLAAIPRSTVRDWRSGRRDTTDRRGVGARLDCLRTHDYALESPSDYSYLLGLYLGDGYIALSGRVWKLRITMDSQYEGIIREACGAMESLMVGQQAHKLQRKTRCVEISMYSKHWPCYFPQHGPGRKHERDVSLELWQQELVDQAPESLVRGLIHSDGCRVVTLDRGVASVRYHFKNRSEDIKRLFCATLDTLAVSWTRPSEDQVAIYRKASVARLDQFVGPEC